MSDPGGANLPQIPRKHLGVVWTWGDRPLENEACVHAYFWDTTGQARAREGRKGDKHVKLVAYNARMGDLPRINENVADACGCNTERMYYILSGLVQDLIVIEVKVWMGETNGQSIHT